MTKIVYLSLGSNLGDRFKNLKKAIQFLDGLDGIDVTKVSSVYETEYWFKNRKQEIGSRKQDLFLNQVIEIKTTLSAFDLLQFTQKVEKDLGRQSKGDLSPRTIDIDILLYGNESIESDELTIPHPRMKERKFVLVPLLEIAPSLPYVDDLKNSQDRTKIELYLG